MVKSMVEMTRELRGVTGEDDKSNATKMKICREIETLGADSGPWLRMLSATGRLSSLVKALEDDRTRKDLVTFIYSRARDSSIQ